jgi:pimeloyl-ACP methyl ester carboxylesterase
VDKYFLVGPIGKFTILLKSAIRLAMFLLPIAPLNFVLKLVCLVVMPHKDFAYGRNLFLACAQRVERKEFVVWCRVVLSFAKTQEQFAKKMQGEPDGLYIVGARDHFFLTMLKSEMKRIKNLSIVENAGHICCTDEYEKVNDLMIAFLETGSIEKVPC